MSIETRDTDERREAWGTGLRGLAAIAVLGLAPFTLIACEDESPFEEATQEMEEAADEVGDAAEETTEALREAGEETGDEMSGS